MLELQSVSPVPGAGSVRRFYAFQLSTEGFFLSAIWILYLQSRGLSLTEIGLAEAAFHLAPVLLELPSGSFADMVGRRWSLALGSALVAASTAVLWIADSLPLAMLALFLHGASFSFRSGANQAFLYDALGDRQSSYAGIFGRLLGASYLVAAAAAWLGATLSDISYNLPFALTIGVALGGVWLAAGLSEPPRKRGDAGSSGSVLSHLGEAHQALRALPTVTAMLVFSGGFWAVVTVSGLYLQAAFSERGLSNSLIGAVVGAMLVMDALGALLAGPASRLGRFSTQIVVLAAISGFALAGTASGTLWFALTAFMLSRFASGVIEPLLFAWFNHQLPSDQRATLLSIESWLFSLTMIFAFPLAGRLAETQGWGTLYLFCGVVTMVMALVILVGVVLRRRFAPGAR
ncbi:MAG: MFS transporter [Chloroflexia bacterium]|nr:MFS transporter [Chloroflexia bacterium]